MARSKCEQLRSLWDDGRRIDEQRRALEHEFSLLVGTGFPPEAWATYAARLSEFRDDFSSIAWRWNTRFQLAGMIEPLQLPCEQKDKNAS